MADKPPFREMRRLADENCTLESFAEGFNDKSGVTLTYHPEVRRALWREYGKKNKDARQLLEQALKDYA